MTIQEQRKQHLDSRLAVYLKDPTQRAFRLGICLYRTPDGRKCFIGQDIPDEKYDSDLEGNGLLSTDNVISLLPKEVVELGIDFLCDCQELHDEGDNWNKVGFTNIGQYEYDRIVEKYCTAP
jgi:hypothetical protein